MREDQTINMEEDSILSSHLPNLIDGLLNWSNEHHQNFKVRVRHLIERLVRQFGFERIWEFTPEAHRKLLTNIRKRKERLKRRQNSNEGANEMEGEEMKEDIEDFSKFDTLTHAALSQSTMFTRPGAKSNVKSTKNAFESALNDSDSDLLDDDSEEEGGYEIATNSILNDLANVEDEEAIESVLSKKLSLAAVIGKRKVSEDNKRMNRMQGRKPGLDKDNDVHVDDEGKMHIGEEDSASEGEKGDDGSDEGHNARAPKQHKTMRALQHGKTKSKPRGDFKKSGDKFEPYSYLPMTRATKKNSDKSTKPSEGKKPVGKYYMKRK